MIVLKLLLIEDSELDAELAMAELAEGGLEIDHERVETEHSLRDALTRREFDVIVSDHTLPQFDAEQALAVSKELAPQTPFIILSGTLGEELAIEMMRRGAADYVLKQRISRLLPSIMRAIREASERRQTLEELSQTREMYRLVVESLTDHAILTLDTAGFVTTWSTGAEIMLGYAEQEVFGKHFEIFFSEDDRKKGAPEAELRETLDKGRAEHNRWQRRKNGELFWASGIVRPLRNDKGELIGFTRTTRDLTEVRRIEDERRRAEEERRTLLAAEQRARAEAELSEARYRSMAEAMPQIVWTANGYGDLTFMNRRWTDVTGLTLEATKAPGGWMSAVHEEDRERVENTIRGGYEQRKTVECEGRILRASDQTYRWHLIRMVPVISASGEVAQWVGTSTDIDDQTRSLGAQDFLNKANAVLVSSLDYEETLTTLARSAVPVLADWCAVDIVQEDGSIKRLAVTHVDPEKEKWGWEIYRKFPPDPNAPTGVPHVIRTGKSDFYPYIPRELLEQASPSQELREIVDSIGFTAAMTVPLVARGITLGALSLVTAESGRRYTENDLLLAEELGRRAGVAVDNSWLYKKAQEEIRERNELEQVLRTSEARFRTMIEQSPLPIQLFAQDGTCVKANKAWEELWDADRSQLIGYNVLNDPQVKAKGILPYIERAFAGEAANVPPTRYDPAEIGKQGRPRWIRAFCYPVREESFLERSAGTPDEELTMVVPTKGPVREMALILEDVTERLEWEEELRTAKDAAEAANKAKDHFLAILSHELRTPLTPVLASVQALQYDPDVSDDIRPWLDIIERNVNLEAKLIDDLLDLTRIARGKLRLNLAPQDLHQTLREVLEMYQDETREKGLAVSFEPRANEFVAHADAARLQQVFWNLLKNAVKFTPAGGKIVVSTENPAPGRIQISFFDTGIGIEPDVLPRIFEAFEQGEQTITRHFGGLGLGLAISKSLVDMHGGTIAASSDGRNTGATFTVEFETSDSPAISTMTRQRPNPMLQTRPRVLLVDEHEDTTQTLKHLLETQGYDVTVARGVADAKAISLVGEFDIVVSEVGLADGSGAEVLSALRIRQAKLPAIALSGYGTDFDRDRARAWGFDEHLVKPATLEAIEEVFRRLLRDGRSR